MKRVCSVVMLGSWMLASTGIGQVIKNPDFETGNALGWTFTNPAYYGMAKEGGYVVSVVKDAAKSRGYVAKMTSTGPSQWGQLKQLVVYKPTDSLETFRVSGYVKLTGVSAGSAGLLVRVMDNGSDLGLTSKGIKGTTDWTRISAEFSVPKQTDSLLLFCSISGPGQVLFDDIHLEKVKTTKVEQSAAAKAYLDTALAIIGRYALYKDSVDFKALVKTAHSLAANAKKASDCYPAIRYVLTGLQDRHSFLRTPEELTDEEDTNAIEMSTGKLIEGNIGYVTVPSFLYGKASLQKKYVDSLQHIIQSLDNPTLIGWIVDDRNNRGGQPWPMIVGLGPILGEGVFDRRIKNGMVVDSVSYRNGRVWSKDSVYINMKHAYSLHHSYPKVALLINGKSASASEMVALSFKHRPKAKLFGEPTYGISTLPHFADLSDGALMAVFTAKQTDRLGNAYGGKIYPDEPVSDVAGTVNDEVIDAAVNWLKEKH